MTTSERKQSDPELTVFKKGEIGVKTDNSSVTIVYTGSTGISPFAAIGESIESAVQKVRDHLQKTRTGSN